MTDEERRQKKREWSRNWKDRHPEAVRLQAQRSYQRCKAKRLARQKARREAGLIAPIDTDTGMLAGIDVAMTFEEISVELGVTRQRVQQIIAKALRKLRERAPNLAELLR